jgi:hypothetical protein
MVPASPSLCFQLVVNLTSAVNVFITVYSNITVLPGTTDQLQRMDAKT